VQLLGFLCKNQLPFPLPSSFKLSATLTSAVSLANQILGVVFLVNFDSVLSTALSREPIGSKLETLQNSQGKHPKEILFLGAQ